MTLKALFILVLSLAFLPKVRHVEPDVNHVIQKANCPPYNSYNYFLLARQLGCNDDKPMHCAQLRGSEGYTVRCLKPQICTQESTNGNIIIAAIAASVVVVLGFVVGITVWCLWGKDCVCACFKNREINQNQEPDNEVGETGIPLLPLGSHTTGDQHVNEIDETTIKRVVNILDSNASSSNPSTDKKRSPKDERPSKKKCNGNKSQNDTKNYPYPEQETEHCSGPKTQENIDNERRQSISDPYPAQETEHSSGPTAQENIDNERRQSISEPETRQDKTGDELSMDTPGDNDETFVKLVGPAKKSDGSSKTAGNISSTERCSPETEKYGISEASKEPDSPIECHHFHAWAVANSSVRRNNTI